jgi:hypothetical protein
VIAEIKRKSEGVSGGELWRRKFCVTDRLLGTLPEMDDDKMK